MPDLVMLTGQTGQKIHEVLTVEVKSGKVLLEIDETQLKYMMLPLVIEQNVAVGLLICANIYGYNPESAGRWRRNIVWIKKLLLL